jgi:septum site-determining protein MinD
VDDPPVDVFHRVLGAPVSTVPADPRVGRSVESERPVGTAAPESDAADAIRSLAAAVRAARTSR